MNEAFFCSDLHLGHKTLMKGFRGTIFSSMEEHDNTITENLLALPRGSRLYILGDLFWKYNSEQTMQFFVKFKKKKIDLHLIEGNHDKTVNWKNVTIKSISQMKSITINKQPIFLCHYPMEVYNRSHYNAWSLYGHVHYEDETWKKNYANQHFQGKKLNVNLELHNFKPWSFDEIADHMSTMTDNWDLIKRESVIPHVHDFKHYSTSAGESYRCYCGVEATCILPLR